MGEKEEPNPKVDNLSELEEEIVRVCVFAHVCMWQEKAWSEGNCIISLH